MNEMIYSVYCFHLFVFAPILVICTLSSLSSTYFTFSSQIADSQADGEFVYLICQSTKTGKVYTVVDQRDEMENAMRTNRDPSDDLISRFFTKKD